MSPQSEKRRVVLLIQGRMGATRLPGKPLKLIMGRPMLSYQLERLRRVSLADEIVLATSTNPLDMQLVDFCKQEELPFFRGSEEDVLERFLEAARQYKADVIVRNTADCPLSDPVIIDKVIATFLEGSYDYVTNSPNCNYPRGTDVEVFSMQTLERVAREANRPEEREHVTPYYYRHPELFKLRKVLHPTDLSSYRLTVDTLEDFALITQIFESLYPKKPQFSLGDVVEMLQQHPEWVAINAHVKQKGL